MIVGGKSKFVSLLSLIKAERPKLYDMIVDLCLDGTFRSQRYKNTFLLPNDELVGYISSLMEKDEDIKAIDTIRSLLLKDHLNKTDFKDAGKIGTLQFGSHILEKPSEVQKDITKSDMSVIVTKEGNYATIVYNYDSKVPPKVIKGTSGGMSRVGAMTGGWANNTHSNKIKDITLELRSIDDYRNVVAQALIALKPNQSKFNRAKFYLAANPILTWFFLTLPGNPNALIGSAELDKIKPKQHVDLRHILKQAKEAGGYQCSKEALSKIHHKRKEITNTADATNIVALISNAYNEMATPLHEAGAIDKYLFENIQMKMLMDELCFIHNESTTGKDLSDSIADLGAINWNDPSESLVICSGVYEKLIKGVEAISSGPKTFVVSDCFLRIPLSHELEAKLRNGAGIGGGSVRGGNPAAINRVIFTGGAAEATLGGSEMDLSKFVDSLSDSQKEKLKTLINGSCEAEEL